MRVGILSDTHDQLARTSRAVASLISEGAEVLIHCGDMTRPPIVRECAGLTCYYVFGNNDFDEDVLRRAMAATGGVCLERGGQIEFGETRIAVTHGDSAREIRRLLATTPNYLLHGHSHAASDECHGATRWINPGALHRAHEWTVAVLDLDSDVLRFLNIR